MNSLYFDYCASAPLHPRALRKLQASMEACYANPSSAHQMGFAARRLVEEARDQLSGLLQVTPGEIIFTSGATESNNLAIQGALRAWRRKTGLVPHILLSEIEHSSVYQCCKRLGEEGAEVTFLPVDRNGIVSVQKVKESLQPNTALVSMMHVNNETGSIQPVSEIGKLIKAQQPCVYFHVDGVQGFGKLPVAMDYIDLYTISGHKIGGPKGVGLLVKKENVELDPLMYGGEQENGWRPGTTNVPAILGFAAAVEAALEEREEKMEHISLLHNYVYSRLKGVPGIILNSPEIPLSSPHIINFSCIKKGITSAMMIGILEKNGIIASSQSACSSQAKQSRVLLAMTGDEAISSAGIRLSFHEAVKMEDVQYLTDAVGRMMNQLPSMNKFELLS
ncbi:aminotransferase V [Paenibacillus antibioticophila]|uniref:cysteine desulfurase n=1 Tax=Paenibacillus antibioticophila TaxID=1274374 RepID=A0A920CFQ3_9BACL|nr:cysteine desulfurase family protein [Paenibacillus antibioticophila]GIO35259.1 aminotransferase V [Paenibacillus antibioticophila]